MIIWNTQMLDFNLAPFAFQQPGAKFICVFWLNLSLRLFWPSVTRLFWRVTLPKFITQCTSKLNYYKWHFEHDRVTFTMEMWHLVHHITGLASGFTAETDSLNSARKWKRAKIFPGEGMIMYDQKQPHTWLQLRQVTQGRATESQYCQISLASFPWMYHHHPTHTWGLRWVLCSLLKASSNALPDPSALRGSGLR